LLNFQPRKLPFKNGLIIRRLLEKEDMNNGKGVVLGWLVVGN